PRAVVGAGRGVLAGAGDDLDLLDAGWVLNVPQRQAAGCLARRPRAVRVALLGHRPRRDVRALRVRAAVLTRDAEDLAVGRHLLVLKLDVHRLEADLL